MNASRNGNGKVTSKQLRAAIARQEKKCILNINARFDKLDAKLEELIKTMGHINVILSERLSNHSARIDGVEKGIAELRSNIVQGGV